MNRSKRSSSQVRSKILTSKWAVRAYALIIFFIAWQIIGEFTSPLFFAKPGVVAVRMVQLLADGGEYGIPVNVLVTIETVLAGFIPAAAVGVPLGILIGRNRVAEYSLDPYISLIYAVPLIVMIPILIIWLGSSIFSNDVLAFIGALFPIAINSISGAKNVRATLLETGRSFGFVGPG
ncbi:MAG: ABC transporter permease, partial [Nitrososphaerales archaeon]